MGKGVLGYFRDRDALVGGSGHAVGGMRGRRGIGLDSVRLEGVAHRHRVGRGVKGDLETNGGSTGPRDDRAWSGPWLSRGVRAGCRYDVRRPPLADANATAVAGAHRVRPAGVAGFSDDGRRTSAATTDAETGLTPTVPKFPSQSGQSQCC